MLAGMKMLSCWGRLERAGGGFICARPLHHTCVVNICGQTYRLRERWKACHLASSNG